MPITRDEVAHLARLSRIALSDAELDHLAPQLDQIITAVAQVQEVAAEGIPPTSHATGLTNVFRDDEPAPCLTPAEALEWKKTLMVVHKEMEGRVGKDAVAAAYKEAGFVPV